jgi:transposase
VTCDDHTEEMTWRPLDVFEHQCEIRGRLPRARWTKTGKIYRVQPPWEGLSKHFTKAFEARALLFLRDMPVAAVARKLHEHDTRLWRMLKAQVAVAHPQGDGSNVSCVGCDEMSVRKGHRSVSVFCDRIAKRVLFATPGKDKSTWALFARALEDHFGHPRAITEVSMAMSPSSIAGVKENIGSQAAIVFDKFHLLAHVNDAVDAVRKAEMRFGGWADREALQETRWVWRKNPDRHTPAEKRQRQRLETLNLLTAKAYQRRLTLQDILRPRLGGGGQTQAAGLVPVGPPHGGQAEKPALCRHAQMREHDRVPPRRHPRALDAAHDQRLHGSAHERFLRHQRQSARRSLHHQSHHHALLRGRPTPPPSPLILAKSPRRRHNLRCAKYLRAKQPGL